MYTERRAQALRGTAVPRAIIGTVRADGSNAVEILTALNTTISGFKAEFKKDYDELKAAHEAFKKVNDEALTKKADVVLTEQVERVNTAIDEHKDKMTATQAAIESMQTELKSLTLRMATAATYGDTRKAGRQDPRTENPNYPAYAKAFETYFRHGDKALEGGEHALRRFEVQAAMTIGSDPDGGYTVLPEIETAIDAVVKQVSPMRSLATVRPISTNEYKKLVNLHGTSSGWVGEQQGRSATATATLAAITIGAMEVYAMPAATQSLLDDAYLDMGAWLADEVQLEFARAEGAAFVAGNGVQKPAGIIGGYPTVANASYTWGNIGFVATGVSGDWASTNKADILVDLYHSINSAYRGTASFLANRNTLGSMRKLKDGQGNYLLNMVFRPEGFLEEIFGRPAVEMVDMPDMAANSFSVAFGDWRRAYTIVDRVGIRVLRDPYSSKPNVLFYTTKRVGGAVTNFEALKLIKFG